MRLEDININQLAFLRGIGMTETHFSEKEAYSEAYNQASNNRNVREYGQDGADYGYYQTNGLDVKDAIKRGIPQDIAIHLNGGGKNGKSTVEQQTIAMHYYLQKRYPTEYENVKKGTQKHLKQQDQKCKVNGLVLKIVQKLLEESSKKDHQIILLLGFTRN